MPIIHICVYSSVNYEPQFQSPRLISDLRSTIEVKQ